jgi:hypothetical protein
MGCFVIDNNKSKLARVEEWKSESESERGEEEISAMR